LRPTSLYLRFGQLKDQRLLGRPSGGGHGIEFSHRLDDQIDGPLATGFTIAGFYENRWNDEATSLNRFMPTSMAILAFLSSSY